jgi:glycosyltransferase involved in cell wall biosynthesis
MKIAIITRAFNRLEYTVQCVNAVNRYTTDVDYEHIIVNNNSTDGTKEWLDWITAMPNGWFNKVKPLHLAENTGDWGGMLRGARVVSKDVTHIMQLDNDMLVPPNWARYAQEFFTTENGVLMFRRTGVGSEIPLKPPMAITLCDEPTLYGKIPFAVACWVCRRSAFKKASTFKNCRRFTASLPVHKLWDVKCHQIEGFANDTYRQHEKYSAETTWKDTQ